MTVFDAGASIGPFTGSLRTLVHELKYRGRRRVASRLAEVCRTIPAIRDLLIPGVVLVPVPLHARRLRERGFNQAQLLAQALGRGAGLPCLDDALVRHRGTASQTGLTAAARRANVSGAFRVRRTAAVARRIVALVDDVYTTGATARACALALRKAGARGIRVITIARVV